MVKLTLGIIGGGQLGSMLASAAKKIDIKTVIFCDNKDAPAQKFSDDFIFLCCFCKFVHSVWSTVRRNYLYFMLYF